MDNLSDYLSMLGTLVHGDAASRRARWEAASPEARAAFLSRLSRDGFGAIAMQRLGEELLPPEWTAQRRKAMQAEMLHALQDEAELRKLYAGFDRAGIRHIPLKGVDLAYRVYPSPTLRHFGDWDIFFPPGDIDRARKMLMADGWKELLTQSKELHHHYSPLTKGRHFLEPHWTFPCCMDASPEEIWELSRPMDGTQCQRVLSPELNVLLAARHAAEDLYRFANLTKLLLDTAFVIRRDGMDWKKLRIVSEKLAQPYPGDLLTAFHEFFPQGLLDGMQGDNAKAAAFRQVFLTRQDVRQATAAEVVILEEDRYSGRWFRRILKVFWPKNLRQKYALPEHGATWKLLMCYGREFTGKCRKFLHVLLRRNSRLEEYTRLVKEAEAQSPSGK